jgi:UDP-N-acetylglucosamine 2-epimerase (non-hydrolysing)/GDP/UDP-N,N'-diacetylbacillosamine 2-epimerase (hydrolysing)
VTGSRAEYGIIYWVLRELERDPNVDLQIVATGMHLSPEFGLTFQQIEQDGFAISAKVEMLLSSDTPVGIAKSIGIGVIGFADAIERLSPDLIVLVGDRFEMLAAAQAALVAGIPIAHLCGGDTTEGAYDEAIRHSLTKMAHLHFPTNQVAAQRIVQLGENPDHIYNFGSTQLDHLHRTELLSRAELEESLRFELHPRNLLVTVHPVTLDSRSSADQCGEILAALASLEGDIGFIFTLPNADNDGRIVVDMIRAFVDKVGTRAVAYHSLGSVRYLSTLAAVDVVVGNSSSGIIEAASFHKPSVNIGDRQRGRVRPSSVMDCDVERGAIAGAIVRALESDCSGVFNPYGDGHSAALVAQKLSEVSLDGLLQKRFHSIGAAP